MIFNVARRVPCLAVIASAALIATLAPTASAADSDADRVAGRQLFEDWGCASCHALKDAGATGRIGPALDGSALTKEITVSRISNGQGAMPAFKGMMTDEEIEKLVSYIAAVRTQ